MEQDEKRTMDVAVVEDSLECLEQCTSWMDQGESIRKKMDQVCKTVVSEVMSQAPNIIGFDRAKRLGESYKTVKDIALQQMKDGTYSATLRDAKGRIVEQVKLDKASGALQSAACMGFTVLNAAVGQANMRSIAESLKRIESMLDESKERDYSNAISKIKSACMGLSDLSHLKGEGMRKSACIQLLQPLREGLLDLMAYVEYEILHMPVDRPSGVFENWLGPTKPDKAEKRFRYILRALEPICQGLVQHTLSEAYLSDGSVASSASLLREVRTMFGKLNDKDGRVNLVPMIDNVDPVKKVGELLQGLDRSIVRLERCEEAIAIPVKASYLEK